MDIDIIIPTYKPGRELFTLLDKLEAQTLSPHEILLINTEEKYFEELTYGTDFAQRYRNVRVLHISKREFDHGRTRRMAVRKTNAEIFVMMTQDAVPCDEYLLERLTAPLTGDVAAAYARQLASEHSSIQKHNVQKHNVLEQFARRFNYPEESRVKRAADLEELGIKTYFCSNVCAAYRRDIYEESGGFVRHTIFNEDMIYAAKVIQAGYAIAYAADACVIHSHNYTCGQQFHRNFDLGVSQAEHPEVFGGIHSESEGKKMVREAVAYLREQHRSGEIPYFILQCGSKYAGYLLGKHYRMIPRRMILACTDNIDYWYQNQ